MGARSTPRPIMIKVFGWMLNGALYYEENRGSFLALYWIDPDRASLCGPSFAVFREIVAPLL